MSSCWRQVLKRVSRMPIARSEEPMPLSKSRRILSRIGLSGVRAARASPRSPAIAMIVPRRLLVSLM